MTSSLDAWPAFPVARDDASRRAAGVPPRRSESHAGDRAETLQSIAIAIAKARRSGTLAHDANLGRISSESEADTVRALAALACGGVPLGYTMTATSAATARLLRCPEPVVAPLWEEHVLPSGATYCLPPGVLGIGAGFTFVVGRSFPVGDDRSSGRDVASVVVAAYPSLQLLGRRVPNGEPLDAWTATADFGLHVLHVQGEAITGWADLDLAQVPVALRLDGHEVGTGHGRDVLGHPLRALSWLARDLVERGSSLEAGATIATGSCTGIAQVTPGATATGDFGPLGRVTLNLR